MKVSRLPRRCKTTDLKQISKHFLAELMTFWEKYEKLSITMTALLYWRERATINQLKLLLLIVSAKSTTTSLTGKKHWSIAGWQCRFLKSWAINGMRLLR